jgi:hypothetical protein
MGDELAIFRLRDLEGKNRVNPDIEQSLFMIQIHGGESRHCLNTLEQTSIRQE